MIRFPAVTIFAAVAFSDYYHTRTPAHCALAIVDEDFDIAADEESTSAFASPSVINAKNSIKPTRKHIITGLKWTYRGHGRRRLASDNGQQQGGDDYNNDDISFSNLNGMDTLQREFFQVHGRNVTEQELQDAFEDAYARAWANRGENLHFEFDPELIEALQRGRALRASTLAGAGPYDIDDDGGDDEDVRVRRLGRRRRYRYRNGKKKRGKKKSSSKSKKKSNNEQTLPFPPEGEPRRAAEDSLLINFQSPSVPGNGGFEGIRGLFWCVSPSQNAGRGTIDTPLNQLLTLKNCKTADINHVSWNYGEPDRLLESSRLGSIFHSFCGRTKDGKQGEEGERIRLDQCGSNFNETQAWEFYTNYQWRSSVDAGLCVATKYGAQGGGTLKLERCVGPDVVEQFERGQLWTFCETTGNCDVTGTGVGNRQLPVTCDIYAGCTVFSQ